MSAGFPWIVYTFRCACGTTVTGLLTLDSLHKTMRVHAESCSETPTRPDEEIRGSQRSDASDAHGHTQPPSDRAASSGSVGVEPKETKE
jgi:hypothetical protein